MLLSSVSADNLLHSFPIFGHPGSTTADHSGKMGTRHHKNGMSVASGSLNRKSTVSTRGGNTTPPTTASTEPLESDFSLSPQLIDEFGYLQKQKDAFFTRTPRSLKMSPPSAIEVYQPSRGSIENYSRPRKNNQPDLVATKQNLASRYRYSSLRRPSTAAKHLTIIPGLPIELNATGAKSLAHTPGVGTQQPRSVLITHNAHNTTTSFRNPQENNRKPRHTPIIIADPALANPCRHTPLEPWVAEHRRKGTDGFITELAFHPRIEIEEDIDTFGAIQRYFDSQIGASLPSPKVISRSYSPSPPNIPLPASPGPPVRNSLTEPMAIFLTKELDLPDDPPPLVPDRSSKRLTDPNLSLPTEPVTSSDGDFDIAADGNYCPYDEQVKVSPITKKQSPKPINVGEAAKAGSPSLGRMAPPILGHKALTASSQLGLNNLNDLLGDAEAPAAEPRKARKLRKKNGHKEYRVKSKKTLASRVGTIEGHPSRPSRRASLVPPSCAKETTTLSGVKHLRIIIPTETFSNNPGFVPYALPPTKRKRRSKHVSITFTDEMFSPLASPQIEAILTGFETCLDRASLSSPVPIKSRSPKKSPKSSKPVPVHKHPLASREDLTRARKLRDLQRVKSKTPTSTMMETETEMPTPTPTPTPTPCVQVCAQHGANVALLTPAQTPEPIEEDEDDESLYEDIDGDVDEENDKNKTPVKNKLTRLQSKVVVLQQQNNELVEALAKMIGLNLAEADLKSEDVLRAFRRTVGAGAGAGAGASSVAVAGSVAVAVAGAGRE